MNLKVVGALVVVVAIIALVIFFRGGQVEALSGRDILTDKAQFFVYQVGNTLTNYALAEMNFGRQTEGEWLANGLVDFNGNGTFEDEEWLVKNKPTTILPNYANRFSIDLVNKDLEGNLKLAFYLTENKIEDRSTLTESDGRNYEVAVSRVNVNEYIDLETPGQSEDLKRGINVAYAQDEEIHRDVEVPDLMGGPMDCFAISAANNIISLMHQHGNTTGIPEPREMIEELKRDMQWDDGILIQNFMAGKNAFVQRYNLPIETREIKRPSLEDLKEALASGGAVEVSTSMIRSESGRDSTGHVITGLGFYQDGSERGLTAHDPATPVGSDVYELSESGGETPFLLLNYPMWDGITVIDAIFIQTWTDGEPVNQTSLGLDEEGMIVAQTLNPTFGSGDGYREVEVLVINNEYYPKSQFHIADPDACKARHWHARSRVYALDDVVGMVDPKPNECGFGKVGEVAEEKVIFSLEDAARFLGELLED